ncbi:tetraspanin-16 isoform X3 [Ornithorhynchus anatinus]|uniref:tetraspanin-16 isoform X3 n=1 Tax=Ornithorhynchus anatinus TaxID=9258 RepID=UPI0010A8774D|nr:tetraspanin-16 isoform X3 [Ornithorhynchus anatinus]
MGCFSFLKMMMFVFNGIIFLGGLALLSLGVWVKVDGGSFVKILGASAPQLIQLINMAHLCIALGSFLLFMGFLGCCGAVRESKSMLLLFFIAVLIIFIAEMTCAVVILAFSSLTDIFVERMKIWAVKTLREDYGVQDDITSVWDTTMKELNCCGFNNYTDFNGSRYQEKKETSEYPVSCCSGNAPCQSNQIDLTKMVAAMVVSMVLYCQIHTFYA